MLGALWVALDGAIPDGVTRAAGSLWRQRFVPAPRLQWRGGSLQMWACAAQTSVDDCHVRTSAGDACCVGPLWYRGQFGRAALRAMMADFGTTGHVDEHALRGTFAAFVRTTGHCVLLNDILGTARIFVSRDGRFYSTSWLACCAYAGRLELDEAAAIEYVLQGASHSDQTLAQGITTLPLAHAFDLTARRAYARLTAGMATGAPRPATFDSAAHEIGAHLSTIHREMAAALPGHIRTALSGGFDSRLILAGLLAAGENPELFVYGAESSSDVIVARAVATSLRIPLDVIDKTVIDQRKALPDLERLVRSALFFDGLPNDGIHDSGADQQTRMQQAAGGFLVLNGGGGEIFRNFFHLPDRSLCAEAIVRAFYRGFDRRVIRQPGALAGYAARMADSIRRTLTACGCAVHQRLTRDEVELVYPLFRCHYWMAVNNSVAIRHGYYATPLVDLTTVQLASQLPLAWKNAGRLESRLIAQLHPSAARQTSSYGFRFSDGPDRRTRVLEMANCRRPVFARPLISATHRRIRHTGVAPDMMRRCRALLPGEWRLDPLLDLQYLPDTPSFSRALAVEVAYRELVPSSSHVPSEVVRRFDTSGVAPDAVPVP